MAKLVMLQPVGGNLYILATVDKDSLPEIDNTLPGSLPGIDRPSQGLPGSGLPGSGLPGNELPTPPPQVQPGHTLVLVRDPEGKWKYASIPPGTPVPEPLPEQPPS